MARGHGNRPDASVDHRVPESCRCPPGVTRSDDGDGAAPGDHRVRRNRLGQDHAAAQDCAGHGSRQVQLSRRAGQARSATPSRAALPPAAWPNALPRNWTRRWARWWATRCGFQDRLQHGDASVKLMTDGILLAETETRPAAARPTTPSSSTRPTSAASTSIFRRATCGHAAAAGLI